MTRIGELGTTLAVTGNRRTLRKTETSVLTKATRRNIPEGGIIFTHRRENIKSYTVLFIITVPNVRILGSVLEQFGTANRCLISQHEIKN
jgi:hypothetical protein